MPQPLAYPAGYSATPGRDEFGLRCLNLYAEGGTHLGSFDHESSAIYAAQDHADALADEASEADAAVAEAAFEETLERYFALISADAVPAASNDPQARGQYRAARALVEAIEAISMGKPVITAARPVAQQAA